jgi:hypothetical protein
MYPNGDPETVPRGLAVSFAISGDGEGDGLIGAHMQGVSVGLGVAVTVTVGAGSGERVTVTAGLGDAVTVTAGSGLAVTVTVGAGGQGAGLLQTTGSVWPGSRSIASQDVAKNM